MGEEPNAPVDSLCAIGVVCPPVTLLPLDDVLQRRADFASTEVNIQKERSPNEKAALPIQSASKHVRHRRMGNSLPIWDMT